MTFDPIKDGYTGGSITKNDRCVDFTKIHLQVQNLKEIRQEMQLLERTQECDACFRWRNTADIVKVSSGSTCRGIQCRYQDGTHDTKQGY